MKSLRLILSVVVLVALGLGYAASQVAALGGTAPQYSTKVDTPAVQWLALLALVVCIGFAFVKGSGADDR